MSWRHVINIENGEKYRVRVISENINIQHATFLG